ncbi:synphilin-1 isoform X1 [Phyllopteryx taeniolatus]|uniref:synphilin-1 isoform X1 n=1 Tax=Phyllopteryx taeniolatus TaxID=161469 RepID=UPI002AD42722|nr:synphilin-1 isoform X1 [Phyllopteryx taeniolatus]XP_061625039.1 synphilin-1 isoform X1 [Phyllopteryx taeniolatus]XP_061625040.1 synphilin-1 isoform X1 [Phyllopteryx taeniolatus]
MEVPEYLDLDEIDFSDDTVYSVSSLKNIPELSRRNDAQAEERTAPSINWSRGVASQMGVVGIKPAGVTEAHSKFRPVKRVSPLKHHPETREEPPGWDSKVQDQDQDRGAANARLAAKDHKLPPNATGGKLVDSTGAGSYKRAHQGLNQGVLGELEHYDLDMDEILDVPFIKSSGQQMSTLPRALDKRVMSAGDVGGATLERQRRQNKKNNKEDVDSNNAAAQMCTLSPLKWSDLRKSKSLDPDLQHLPRSQSSGGLQHHLHHHHHQEVALSSSSSLLSCSSSLSSFLEGDKLLSARVYPEAQNLNQNQRPGLEPPVGGAGVLFPLLAKQDSSKPWSPASGQHGGASGGVRGGGAEVDEESKKKHNIINIVREGQISLLPHLAADNLSLIRDEVGNNLLHVSASQGHAECLQHLTSLMGEDGLNERNQQQLTPAGLAVKNGHLECVRWMVSETEAIAELSCTREHPSLIHYAARYGQEKVLLWLLQFMQEQAISLDEVDHNGNTGVHVAAQYGHLTCIQTLVEYGSNVTVLNQHGERPSQLAERQGHSPCARYLVVVETCMSLASQVVKLTKQLTEQAAEKATLQKQLHKLDTSSNPSGIEAWPEMMLSVEGTSVDGDWLVRQETGLRKDPCEPSRAGGAGAAAVGGPSREGVRRSGTGASAEKREQKLARLKQMMQRSLSESDSDAPPRPDRPTHLPINDEEPASKHLHLVMRKHLPLADRKPISKPVNGVAFTPSEAVDATGETDAAASPPKAAATSPKSALKSPSSRRKTAHSLKLRVTFNEHLHQEAEPIRAPPTTKEATSTGSSEAKRPFGALRSIMETLSGNANNNNNTHNTTHNQLKNKNRSTNV